MYYLKEYLSCVHVHSLYHNQFSKYWDGEAHDNRCVTQIKSVDFGVALHILLYLTNLGILRTGIFEGYRATVLSWARSFYCGESLFVTYSLSRLDETGDSPTYGTADGS